MIRSALSCQFGRGDLLFTLPSGGRPLSRASPGRGWHRADLASRHVRVSLSPTKCPRRRVRLLGDHRRPEYPHSARRHFKEGPFAFLVNTPSHYSISISIRSGAGVNIEAARFPPKCRVDHSLLFRYLAQRLTSIKEQFAEREQPRRSRARPADRPQLRRPPHRRRRPVQPAPGDAARDRRRPALGRGHRQTPHLPANLAPSRASTFNIWPRRSWSSCRLPSARAVG
jgi:hypothetical protein